MYIGAGVGVGVGVCVGAQLGKADWEADGPNDISDMDMDWRRDLMVESSLERTLWDALRS